MINGLIGSRGALLACGRVVELELMTVGTQAGAAEAKPSAQAGDRAVVRQQVGCQPGKIVTPVRAQGTLLRSPPVAIGKGDSKGLERRGPEEREATHRLAAYLICALLPVLLKGNGSEGQRASARPRLVGVHVLVKQVRAIAPVMLGEEAGGVPLAYYYYDYYYYYY